MNLQEISYRAYLRGGDDDSSGQRHALADADLNITCNQTRYSPSISIMMAATIAGLPNCWNPHQPVQIAASPILTSSTHPAHRRPVWHDAEL